MTKKSKSADQILKLSETCILAFDDRQWIVKRKGGSSWSYLGFIATNKSILFRVLRENDVEVTPVAKAALDAMPDTFREWYRQHLANEANPNIDSKRRRAA